MNEIEHFRKKVETKSFKLTNSEIKKFTDFHCSFLLRYHKPALNLEPKNTPISLCDGTDLLTGFERIVVGAHGPYIEFNESQLNTKLTIPTDQLWRTSPEYNVKYEHLTAYNSDVKIYYQVGKVNYADYRKGYYYVDFFKTNLVLVR
ncbi:MAG: hypothetical protein GWO20_06895 [Candidatus Korarchaeota archaeon]|nr:hypothetical protein [Candidatus Korarchaeota archaeon]